MPSLNKQNRKDTVLQFRVNFHDKSTIQRAAELKGLEPSMYIRSLILENAKNEIRRADKVLNQIFLSSEKWEQFIEIMNAPVTVNENLKKDFADFKKKYGSFKN